MPRPRPFYMAAAAAIAVAGCAHAFMTAVTSMTSVAAPEIRGHSFQVVLVVAQVADLGLRFAMEDRFVSLTQAPRLSPQQMCAAQVQAEALSQGYGHNPPANFVDSATTICLRRGARLSARFVAAHTLFFAGRDYTSEQVVEVMRQNGIDATLVITPGERGSTEGFLPPSYATRCTGFNFNLGCIQTTTTATGGLSFSKPWQQFTAKLYDASNGQVVWIATAVSGGNAFAQSVDLVLSMADQTFQHLVSDRLLP
jgi:hypothetical protein